MSIYCFQKNKNICTHLKKNSPEHFVRLFERKIKIFFPIEL